MSESISTPVVDFREKRRLRDEVKKILSEILYLPEMEDWWVNEVVDDLAIISIGDRKKARNFKTMKEREGKVGIDIDPRLGGCILDFKEKKIACPSIGLIPSIVSDELPVTDGTLNLKSGEYPFNYSFPADKVKYEVNEDGAVIRIFKYKDKIHLSTLRKINAKDTTWGNTKTLFEMYTELGGPDLESLFPQDGDLDNVTFIFLIVHPELQSVGQNLPWNSNGRLSFLEARRNVQFIPNTEMKHDEPFPFGLCHPFLMKTVDHPIVDDLRQKYPSNPVISREEAIEHLRGGVKVNGKIDYRASGGGSILVTYEGTIVRVVSRSYDWRFNMKMDEADPEKLVYRCIHDGYVKGKFALEFKTFIGKYINLQVYSMDDLENYLSRGELPPLKYSKDQVPDVKVRCGIILMNLLLVVSPCHRMKLLRGYRNLFKDRTRLQDWLYQMYYDRSEPSPDNFIKTRISQIISESVTNARSHLSSHGGTISKAIKDKIRETLYREKGDNLYHMMKLMRSTA